MLGFLSPDGKYYECNYGDHIKLATRILETFYHIESATPVDKLCSMGWISIQEDFIGFVSNDVELIPSVSYQQKSWFAENKSKMTNRQQDMIQRCLNLNSFMFG